MKTNFSWDLSAQKYIDLYNKITLLESIELLVGTKGINEKT